MGNPVNTVGPGGVSIPRSAEEAAALGATVQDPNLVEATAAGERRRKMFGGANDMAVSLAEGVVDAFTAGFIREHGEEADLRREATPGSVFLGEALGTAAGLITGVGPVKSIAGAGEALGKTAAQAVLRQGEKAIVTTALKEAGAGAALTGATSFGHQLMDTVIEDKAFSGEAVLDEAKLGGVIGLVGGGLMGGFGKLAGRTTRAEVAAQGGVLGDIGESLGHIEEARAAYGEALHFHEQQLGALKEFRRSGALGEVSDDFLRVRSQAIRDARAAQSALRDIDVEAALSGKDPAAYKNLQRRWSEYTRAMDDVDEIMTPHSAERAQVRGLAEEAGPAGETRVGQTSSATAEDMAGTQVRVRQVQGAEDFVVPASRVAEAIPSSAEEGYLARYKSRAPDQVEGAPTRFPEGTPSATPDAGTVAGKRNVTPSQAPSPQGLAELDAAIKDLPLRTGQENAGAMGHALDTMGGATQMDVLPLGAVAKQLDAADAAAAKAAEKAPTQVRAEPLPQEPPARIEKPRLDEVGKRLLDNWLNVAEPRMRPWQQAQARAQAAMDALYQKTGGRLDSARGLGILEADGIKPSTDSVGSYMDSVYAMQRAGRFVADEARGVATPLRDAGHNALKAALGGIGAKLLGAKHAMLIGGFLGYGGRVAAASGRLYRHMVEAVAGFLSSTKLRSLAAGAGNTAWAYSDKGPIKDPVARIQEIQFLALNPDGIRERIRAQAGELYAAAPEHIKALEDRAVAQVQALAIRAPAIYWDKLGRPLMPPQGKLRAFYEFENATNDLSGILDALRTGGITRPQIEALQVQWPAAYTYLVQGLLNDPTRLQKFDRSKLRVIEQVAGVPLTNASDPMFMARQQEAWQPPPPQPGQGPTGQPAQSFKLRENAPTPAQANASGRAPGNY